MVIYKAIFPNGKVYIGKTKNNLKDRINKHISQSKYLQTPMAKAIRKYGRISIIWEILKECSSLDELNNDEIFFIKEYNSSNRQYGYNVTNGGDGGNTITNNDNKLEIIKKQLKTKNINNYVILTAKIEEEILKKYIDYKYSIKRIARETNINKNRITKFLKSKNIVIDKDRCKLTNSINLLEEQVIIVIDSYKNGKNIKTISMEQNLTIQIVSRILHDNGVRKSKRFRNGKRYDGKQPKNELNGY